MVVTVNLIGAGRVGQTFLRILKDVEYVKIGNVVSRQYDNAIRAVAFAGQGRAVERLEDMNPAQLWLIAVPDDQIGTVSKEMSQLVAAVQPEQPVAVHFSGFFPSSVMKPLQEKGWMVASCHPVLSFAEPETAAEQLAGTFCGLEGDAGAVALLGPLLTAIGCHPFSIHADGKALYHAAAVFSNNFTVVLQAIAMEAWQQSGVDPDTAKTLCSSLVAVASANVARLGAQQALTGPAARGDREVMSLQKEQIAAWHAEAGEIYGRLSEMAVRLKQTGTTRS